MFLINVSWLQLNVHMCAHTIIIIIPQKITHSAHHTLLDHTCTWMCMYVCTCTCTMCMYVNMYVDCDGCVHVCTSVRVCLCCVHMYVCVCAFVRAGVSMYTYMYVQVCPCTRICTCRCVHVHVYTCVHVCLCVCACVWYCMGAVEKQTVASLPTSYDRPIRELTVLCTMNSVLPHRSLLLPPFIS